MRARAEPCAARRPDATRGRDLRRARRRLHPTGSARRRRSAARRRAARRTATREHLGRYADVDDASRRARARGRGARPPRARALGRSARSLPRASPRWSPTCRRSPSTPRRWWPGVPRAPLRSQHGRPDRAFSTCSRHPRHRAGRRAVAPALPRARPPPPPALRLVALLLGRVAPRDRASGRPSTPTRCRATRPSARPTSPIPLVHRAITAGFFRALRGGAGATWAEAPTLRCRCSILQGDADRIVDPARRARVRRAARGAARAQ